MFKNNSSSFFYSFTLNLSMKPPDNFLSKNRVYICAITVLLSTESECVIVSV